MKHLTWILCAMLLSAACGGGNDDDDDIGGDAPPATDPVTAECSELGEVCILPYPNSAFETLDSSTTTGLRTQVSTDALFGGLDPDARYLRADGFSPNTALMAAFDAEIDTAMLPADYADALAANAPIRLVNIDGDSVHFGEAVPLYAEAIASEATDRQLLVLTPLHRLEPASRYLAVITDSLTDADGSPLPRTAAMTALLERSAEGPQADYYDPLIDYADEQMGIAPESIVMLWDFHTRSDEEITTDLRSMRQNNLDWLANNPPAPAVLDSEEISGGRIAYTVRYEVPIYRAASDAPLSRDADDLPTIDRVDELEALVVLPENATTDNPAKPILFGHGLGMNKESMLGTAVLFDIESGPFALVLTDWDIHGPRGGGIAELLSFADPARLDAFAAVMQQSAADTIVLRELLRHMDGVEGIGGRIDPDRFFYGGVSLGAIIGTIVTSINDEIEASALNVGGGGWINLIRFSSLAGDLGVRTAVQTLLEESDQPLQGLPSDLATEVLLVMAQQALDPGDPIHFGAHVIHDRFEELSPDPPAVILQESIGDGIVPNLTTESLARTMGLPLIEPAVRGIDGLESATAPTGGSPAYGMTQFRVTTPGAGAHLAFTNPVVYLQITDLYSTLLDDDPENDGDIFYRCDGGPCDLLAE